MGNPGTRLSLIGFSKKRKKKETIKVFWSSQVCTRAGERAACLACQRFFPRNVEVNTPGRFFIVAIPKQRLHD